jgi:V/A-type H+-transporting ATPase subunit D
MSDRVATRSTLVELREEHHSMREGYTFLDEKCLLLAGAMLAELTRFENLWRDYAEKRTIADDALRAALGRHGLEGLAIYPLSAGEHDGLSLEISRRSIMGVPLLDANPKVRIPAFADPLLRSPEAEACAQAHAALLLVATELAAAGANLERLHHEYRRTSRRARALDAVLLPEIGRDIDDMTLTLEEQERDEAVSMRPRGK